jgi:curved DNA-binding protein CbpA
MTSKATKDHDAKVKELRDTAQKLLALDYFAALGLKPTASADEVKRAFIEAVKVWHPDRVPSGLEDVRPLFTKVFARLELARATVSDPGRRGAYIQELANKPSLSEQSAAEATLEFQKAEGLLKKHDVAQAEHHARRAVHLSPTNIEYQALLIWVQVKPDSSIARLRELLGELDRLIVKSQGSERAYFYRANVRKRLDMVKESIADFTRAADLNPHNVDAAREVRLFRMRKEQAEGPEASGVGGFFKKLWKR